MIYFFCAPLQAAINAVKKGQTIKLKSNVTISETIKMNRNVKFTLNLNKKKITSKNCSALAITKGTVIQPKDAWGSGAVTVSGNFKKLVISGGSIIGNSFQIDINKFHCYNKWQDNHFK